MKRTGQIIGRVADPDNLRLAFWKARKGKNHALEVAQYRANLEANLFFAIREFISKELLCELKPIQLNRSSTGLPFLGYHIFPFHVRLLQQSKQRYIRKLALAETRLATGEWSEARYRRHVEPLLAFTQHADVTGFRRKIQQGI